MPVAWYMWHIDFATIIIGPPNGPVLFCMLSASSVGVMCRNARGRSAAARRGAWSVRRLTLHGRTLRFSPIRATPIPTSVACLRLSLPGRGDIMDVTE